MLLHSFSFCLAAKTSCYMTVNPLQPKETTMLKKTLIAVATLGGISALMTFVYRRYQQG